MQYNELEKELLTQLQRGLPIVSRPFAALAENCGTTEPELFEFMTKLQAEHKIRRLGGVFDARRLGYRSVLCALDVDAENIERMADIVSAHPGVTHCYERAPREAGVHYPTLWFTFATLQDEFTAQFEKMRTALAPFELFELPAVQRFKIDVVFNMSTRKRDEQPTVAKYDGKPLTFDALDRNIVRALDHNIPLVSEPFKAIAAELGITEEALLEKVREWKENGVMRRMGAVLFHRKVGFTANGMCVWPASNPEQITEIGRKLSSNPEVTHCYQRPRTANFPFDLYAMIHTDSWEGTEALFDRIGADAGLSGGKLLCSVREFKKASMQYFKD